MVESLEIIIRMRLALLSTITIVSAISNWIIWKASQSIEKYSKHDARDYRAENIQPLFWVYEA